MLGFGLAIAAAGCEQAHTVSRDPAASGASGAGPEELGADDPPATPGTWQPASCEVDENTFTQRIDFAAIYQPAQRHLFGVPCRTATDAARCANALSTLERRTHATPFLLLTAGDEVLFVQEIDDLVTLLAGSIDSHREAVLAALLNGAPPTLCDTGAQVFSARVRTLGDEYEIAHTQATCDGVRTDNYMVHASGHMTYGETTGSTCVNGH